MASDPEPQQEVKLWTVVKRCSPHVRHTARMWLFYTLFYWTLPTLIVLFGLWIAKKPVNFLDLIIHGEFLIYAITIVAGSTRLISKDMPTGQPFINRQGFNLVSHVMIFPAIFTYGLLRYIYSTTTIAPVAAAVPVATSSPTPAVTTTAASTLAQISPPVSVPIVVTYSVILLVAAFIFSYVVFLIDAQRSAPGEIPQRAVSAIIHSSDKMNQDFDKLEAAESAAQGGNPAAGPPPGAPPPAQGGQPVEPGAQGPAPAQVPAAPAGIQPAAAGNGQQVAPDPARQLNQDFDALEGENR